MKPIEQLTYQGQVRRIRRIALDALGAAEVRHDRVELIFHGENTMFRARHADGDHFVRVHRPGYQTRAAIASELELLERLSAETDLIVPRPVGGVRRFGAPGVDPRNVVVFGWIHGRFSQRFSPRSMRRLGALLAKLHLFAERFVPSDRFQRNFWGVEGMTGENMGGSLSLWPAESREFVSEVAGRAADAVDSLERARDVWGIIHADLHHGNRLVCRGGELAVIDWDDCGFGPYLYDIAVSLGYPRVHHADRYPALRGAFLRGYRAHRPLSDDHVALLPAFFALRQIGVTLWVLHRAADNPYFAGRAPHALALAMSTLRDLESRAR